MAGPRFCLDFGQITLVKGFGRFPAEEPRVKKSCLLRQFGSLEKRPEFNFTGVI
jgi:hypothetical protein